MLRVLPVRCKICRCGYTFQTTASPHRCMTPSYGASMTGQRDEKIQGNGR